jgi:protein-tyrosine-phosphatase
MKHPFTAFALGVALQLARPAYAESITPNDKTIVFVCVHGSVKSQIAAAYFNRIARERGLPYTAVSRGIEVDTAIPASIRNGLNSDGLAPTDDIPRPLTATEAGSATKVIAFDSVPDDKKGVAEVNYWSDVPPATRNYAAARDVIARHIDDLVPALAALTARPGQTVRGMVAGTDEGRDRITLRVPNDDSEDFRIETFRVQDGLVFNAVRFGDQVEVTVEHIDGARTIVALKKE